MLQKYRISIEREENLLTIKEYIAVARIPKDVECSDLRKEDFLLTHSETYDTAAIQSSASEGKQSLITELRSDEFYPTGPCAGIESCFTPTETWR